jgi:hypothetical protein
MLKIELSVKRQNDQDQRKQFTFYFSEKFLRRSIKSLKSWKWRFIFILFDFLVRILQFFFLKKNKYFCLI